MKIILFGAPGSGKGTQADDLCRRLNIAKISLGDILRGEVKKDTELGRELKGYMDKGLLVPDEVVAKVVETNVDSKGFVLDGYPRNLNQAKTLDDIFIKKNITYDVFVNLKVGEQTIIERLSRRRVCKQCGHIYHLVNMPPLKEGICDKCGSTLIQRDDDRPEVIKKRCEVFDKESKPVIDFYKKQNKFLEVDGCASKEEIFGIITKTIGQ